MTRHVLVPLDGSEQAERAFEFALSEYDNARLTLLHVVDLTSGDYGVGAARGITYPSPEAYDRAAEAADALLTDYRVRARADTVETDAVTEFGTPAREIVRYATEHDVDHIVIGSHGRTGASRVLLGSVAETVARRAPSPVTVVR